MGSIRYSFDPMAAGSGSVHVKARVWWVACYIREQVRHAMVHTIVHVKSFAAVKVSMEGKKGDPKCK